MAKEQIDFFIAEIIKIGNSLGVTIPSRHVKFSDLKEGQTLKVYYKIVKDFVPADELEKEG